MAGTTLTQDQFIDDPDDDADDEQLVFGPLIIRGGARLDIDEIVDLQSRKLRDRYSDKAPDSQHQLETSSSSKKTAGKWVQDKYDPSDLDF